MTGHTKQNLKDLLTKEREVIKGGFFNDLPSLVSEKEKLIQELENGTFKTSELEDLKSEAERNEAHLSAAKHGIAAVQKRVKAFLEGGRSFTTYSADGTSQKVLKPKPHTDRTV